MNPNQSAEDFFSKLPTEEEKNGKDFQFFEEKPAEEPKEPEQKPEKEEAEEPKAEERKKPSRSERREERQTNWLTQQLREEREARIRMEEQLKSLASQKDIPVDPDIKRLLTEAKDPKEATEIFDGLLKKIEQKAIASAEERFRQLSAEDEGAVDAQASEINEALEDIEDAYGVELPRGSELRSDFLDFVERISPKNSDDLPDMNEAWEIFSEMNKPRGQNVEQKKQISARSMVKSTNSNSRPPQSDLKPVNFDNIRSILSRKFGGE